MKWLGQNIFDIKTVFRDVVDFSKNVTFYQPVNDANPKISIGSSDDERLAILVNYKGTTTQEAQIALFKTFTESTTAHDGKFIFAVDEVNILQFRDDGINLLENMGIVINGTDILTDSSGTATLSNIDALDATTIATFETAMEANLDTLSSLTTVGTIGTGVWNGTRIASGYLDTDTAHLTTDQTFTGVKTFDETIVGSINGSSATVATIAGLAPNTATTQATQAAITTCANLTTVGTVGTGVWQGTTIKTAYIGDDQVTEDKLADTLLAEIDANTAKVTNADQSKADINALDITEVGTISSGVWQGTAVASAYLDADTAHLSGAQTFTGTKTLNSFKGTAGATVTNILDEDAMGSNSATALATQQSIKAYADTKVSKDTTKQFTHHQITDDIDATDVVFISLGEIDAETTTSTNTKLPILAPVAGKLLKVFIRTSSNMSGVNLTLKLYTRTTSQSTNGPGGETGAITATGPNNKTMTTFDFTGTLDGDTGTNAIVAGDKVTLSIESSGATANTHFFISCLWEWDLS